MSGFKLRGFKKDGQKLEIKEAPPELKEVQAQQEEFLDAKPSPITTVVKQMFGKKTAKAKPETSTAPIVETPSILPSEEKVVIKKKEASEPKATLKEITDADYDEALQKLGSLILEEDKGDPYVNDIPPAYVPQSRRGFSEFIKENFSAFMLKPVSEQTPIEPGDKYPYQKFVREYIRNASPYRGILVYHGLGSGKTCSAIAASEALFSTAHKKIIVMTPFSLRKNFLKEITFCGFKHYQLQNYWVSLDKSNPTHVLFAEKILNVSKLHLKSAKHIWVPDFTQPPNYNSLNPDEQTEIRKQILSCLVYDRKTNPTGRIHFINYNGISANRLKEIACKDPTYFDNAVIIVDEIHNLIRLMTGKIEPYLASVAGKRRRIVQEVITAEKWKPSLCLTGRNYRRGYLFYRLMLSATNSKIIGLSGTPLINFPEELGILANVLHGYIHVIEGIIGTSGDDAKSRIEELLYSNEYTDFIRVEPDKAGNGIRFYVSLLPECIRKISNDVGVERIPEGVNVPSREEIFEELKTDFTSKGFTFSLKPQLLAKPLLPITHEEYDDYFLEGVDKLKNKAVLLKRLTGIVSYYRGSRLDLMPKVIKDEVVRCPMSEYQQNMYILERAAEINRESSKKSTSGATDPIWSEVFEIAQSSSSNSYRMGSRQTCNFVFPPQVTRPRPQTQGDYDVEAIPDEDINETAPDLSADAPEFEEEFPEISDDSDELTKEQIRAEENAAAHEEQTGGYDSEGGGDDDDDDEDEGVSDDLAQRTKKAIARKARRMLAAQLPEGALEDERKALKKKFRKEVAKMLASGEVTLEQLEEENRKAKEISETYAANVGLQAPITSVAKVKKPKTVKQALTERKIQQSDCKAGHKPDETYKDSILRAKRCLVEFASENLRIDNPEGLALLSSKYVAMLKNIQEAPGSSLVYSQFLDMEGIGIFRICMDINGYAPIEIVSSDAGGYKFSDRTVSSFKKGALQPRYITFSGAEAEDVRKLGLDVFNARFNELPESLSKVLIEAGFEDNKRGQICRCFCITSAGAEGLSLKNVRAVHIMEPYWNDVRLKQVKGRAIRIGSHLDLPPEERNVSIYTYVSVFSNDSQKARAGPMKIDETIAIKDSYTRKDAIQLGLKVDEDMNSYTTTSDEHLYIISSIKKKIMDELETIMKSASIDCELNYAENKDGTYRCLPLKGKIGDFLYHPDLQTDIRESASMFELSEKKEVKKVTYLSYKGKRYASIASTDKYVLYDPENLEVAVGEAMMRDGKPALPITLF